MGLAVFVDERYRRVEALIAQPQCGEDFCDQCGDCLHCYGGDRCYDDSSGEHSWIIYADAADEFRRTHPDLRSLPTAVRAPAPE